MTTRSEQLDRMTEEDKQADILENIQKHGCIRIHTRQQLQFWYNAIQKLADDGTIRVENVVKYDDQYSYIKVTAP